jgi:hypothetical protein
VEQHASDTDRKVAQESYQKDTLMAITDAAGDPLVGKKRKHQIRQRVDNLGRIDGGIVVLETRVSRDNICG